MKVADVWKTLDQNGALDWSLPTITVTCDQIKAIGGEPRLAAKFDSSYALPALLKIHDRFIMPTPGGYHLHTGIFHGYKTLPTEITQTVQIVGAKRDLFTFGSSISENSHLRYAYREGVFSHFLQNQGTLRESWSGRRHIGQLTYHFNGTGPWKLAGQVQIEVDMGLAIDHSGLLLIEGKVASKRVTDFNVRQLFLPYLDALNRLPKGTNIYPVFFEIQPNGAYHIHQYSFGSDDITSIKHVRSVEYIII